MFQRVVTAFNNFNRIVFDLDDILCFPRSECVEFKTADVVLVMLSDFNFPAFNL